MYGKQLVQSYVHEEGEDKLNCARKFKYKLYANAYVREEGQDKINSTKTLCMHYIQMPMQVSADWRKAAELQAYAELQSAR